MIPLERVPFEMKVFDTLQERYKAALKKEVQALCDMIDKSGELGSIRYASKRYGVPLTINIG